jgi:valyl-tRNA synthetase
MTTAPEIPTQNLPSQYDPTDAEARWQRLWERQGAFNANVESDRPVYCVVIPPPNVTHRGHHFTQKNDRSGD